MSSNNESNLDETEPLASEIAKAILRLVPDDHDLHNELSEIANPFLELPEQRIVRIREIYDCLLPMFSGEVELDTWQYAVAEKWREMMNID